MTVNHERDYFALMAYSKGKMQASSVPGKKAGPNGSFPVGDPKHARLAIGAATRSEHAGHISSSTAAHIKTEARKELSHNTDHANGMHRAAHAMIDKLHPRG